MSDLDLFLEHMIRGLFALLLIMVMYAAVVYREVSVTIDADREFSWVDVQED